MCLSQLFHASVHAHIKIEVKFIVAVVVVVVVGVVGVVGRLLVMLGGEIGECVA